VSYEVKDENHLQQIIASISALKGKEVEIGIFGQTSEVSVASPRGPTAKMEEKKRGPAEPFWKRSEKDHLEGPAVKNLYPGLKTRGWGRTMHYPGFLGGGEIPTRSITMLELAVILHEGMRIRVTPKMRGWLASHGLWLKRETKVITIPPRPFIDPVMQDAEEKVVAILESALTDACEARPVSGTATYERIGLTIKGLIQTYMLELKNPPNHPFTIAMKGSSKPLVDHGNLVGAIVHEVRDKGLVPAGSTG